MLQISMKKVLKKVMKPPQTVRISMLPTPQSYIPHQIHNSTYSLPCTMYTFGNFIKATVRMLFIDEQMNGNVILVKRNHW